MADRTGQQLGNYRLLCLLGRGGFSEVYLGQHIHLETQAAIKVLHTVLVDEDIERFRAEARMIARLQHPHIVRVLEFGIEGNVPFLVMDYAPGGTLRRGYPTGNRLPLETARVYINQLASALQYAHDRKVIHRDVKPENMLLGSGRQLLLSDFGIALIAYSSRSPHTQNAAGTINYMAPEHIQGHPHFASDQYSLGIVIYEWLCGTRPFHGSFTELCTQHLIASPPPLHQWAPTLPPAVEQVVLTALAKDPARRFASIQAFAAAFEQACQPQRPSASYAAVKPQPTSFQGQSFQSVLAPVQPEPIHPLQLVPQRTIRAQSGENSLLQIFKPAIADKQARQLYEAIDGRTNLEELRIYLSFSVPDMYRAARFLLLQQRIELHLPGGGLPSLPQAALIPPAAQTTTAPRTSPSSPLPSAGQGRLTSPIPAVPLAPAASQQSPTPLQLVPQRVERANVVEAGLLRHSQPVIADKQARRLYEAIDGKKNLEELRIRLTFSVPDIYRAARFLLLQQRIELYMPGGALVEDGLQLLKD